MFHSETLQTMYKCIRKARREEERKEIEERKKKEREMFLALTEFCFSLEAFLHMNVWLY